MVNGRRLKELRVQQRLTQLQLANACGVTQAMISIMERGETDGTVTTLKKIADALGTTIEKLLQD